MKRWTIPVGLLLLGLSTHAAQQSLQPSHASGEHQSAAASKPDVHAAGAIPGSPINRPWELTDEERVAIRFDPASVHDRAAAHAAALGARGNSTQPSVRSQSQSPGQPHVQQYVLDGARDPALFLPFELLDVLLQGLDSDVSRRTHARVALAKSIRDMGYTEDGFWNKLREISGAYLALSSRPNENITVQRFEAADGKVVSFPVDIERCVARDKVLRAARTTFGAQTFQRFLYTAVAPQVQQSVSTQQVDPAQQLLFISRGCRQ